MKKNVKIFLLIVTFCLVSFGFQDKVSADTLYKCEYGESKNKVTLTIKDNYNLTPTYKVTKWNGKTLDPQLNGVAQFWDTDTNSTRYFIGARGCPNRITVLDSGQGGGKAHQSQGILGTIKIWAFWDKDEFEDLLGEQLCTDNDGDCNELALTKNKTYNAEKKICYYDRYGSLTSNQSDSVLFAWLEGNVNSLDIHVKPSTPETTNQGSTYPFKGNGSVFIDDGDFECIPKIYVCKRGDIKNTPGVDQYYVFPTAEERESSLDCVENIDDIQADGEEENDQSEGQEPDKWLDPVETVKPKHQCEIINTKDDFFQLLKQIIGYLQIGTVFLVLVLGILDLGGAVASSDDDAFKKAGKKFGKRLIAAALVFLVPLIVNFIINLVNLGACEQNGDTDYIGGLFD